MDTMTDGKPYGGFSQPGGRSTRQENKDTELFLPGLQAALRSVVDIIAVLLVFLALVMLGRWVIWGLVALFFFSEAWDCVVDTVLMRLYGAGAGAVEVGAAFIKYSWLILGYPLLRVIWPFTWTMEEFLFQRAVIEPAWPFIFTVAVRWAFPFTPLARLIAFIVALVPLLSWLPLRDRLKWALWEFTPFGPVDVSTQGIDPRRWGPRPEPAPEQPGMGVIFEKTDYEPHVERLGEGVYISNGSGHSSVRIDMRWVTEEQWRAVAQALIVDQQPFSEEVLGRGRIFPTHGPWSELYNANLGFRFFRAQMIEAGRAELRGSHENSGVDLTIAGISFLRRRFVDGAVESEEDDDVA